MYIYVSANHTNANGNAPFDSVWSYRGVDHTQFDAILSPVRLRVRLSEEVHKRQRQACQMSVQRRQHVCKRPLPEAAAVVSIGPQQVRIAEINLHRRRLCICVGPVPVFPPRNAICHHYIQDQLCVSVPVAGIGHHQDCSDWFFLTAVA